MATQLVSHVGIAVRDLDAAIARYRLITGTEPSLVTEVPDQKVKVAIFAGVGGEHGGGRVELVAPTSDDSPISGYLAKRGEGLHHLCLYVSDLDARLRELQAEGCRLIDQTPRLGAEGNRIAFVHPATGNGVLIELEEKK